ncbi:MAG: hypothetical protein PSX36_01940 [bacterium]|nr:hypothetical protein [bacterium]
MTEQKEKKENRRAIILWSIILLLLATNGLTIWLWLTGQTEIVRERIITRQVMVERETIQSDLESLKKDYETLQTSDAAMQVDIELKRARIDELIAEAKRHKGDAYIISQLRKETETLRAIMIGYVRTIDSLNTLNINLVAEKKVVLKQLDVEKEKQGVLVKEKDQLKSTIAKGSVLSCFNIIAKGISFKRGGKKESETTRAKKTQKIKVSFSLGENKIAKAGEKTIYIRIMTPDGKEMAKGYDDNYKFVFNKSSGYFAGKEELNYANTEITGVTYCEGQGEFVPGTYMIEITCDQVVIGNSTLKLD